MKHHVVHWQRHGDTHQITEVFFGQESKGGAEQRAAELRADDKVLWVRVWGKQRRIEAA